MSYPTLHIPGIHETEFLQSGHVVLEATPLTATADPIQERLNLLEYCSSIVNQGLEGDCTGEATVKLIEFWELFHGLKPFVRRSPQFNYCMSRAREGTLNKDSGSFVNDALNIPVQYGAAPLSMWQQDSKTEFVMPPPKVMDEASKFKADRYEMITCSHPDEFALAIQAYMSKNMVPVSFAGAVTKTLMNPRNGVVDVGEVIPDEGHNYVLFGYEPDPEKSGHLRFIAANSWGEEYGIKIEPFPTAGLMYITDDWVNKFGWQAGALYYKKPVA